MVTSILTINKLSPALAIPWNTNKREINLQVHVNAMPFNTYSYIKYPSSIIVVSITNRDIVKAT